MKNYRFNRISIVRWAFCILGIVFVIRLFYIQVIRHPWYQAMAEGKLAALIERQSPVRGEIVVLDGSEENERVSIAMNQKTFVVFAEPRKVLEENKIAQILAGALGLEEKEVVGKLLQKDDSYVPFKHFVPQGVVDTLIAQNLAGVGFSPEMKRLYPEKLLFSMVSGFLGYRGDRRVGQYGLEEFYEQTLAGDIPLFVLEEEKVNPPMTRGNGNAIVTTLNKTVQQKACEFLALGVANTESEGGSIVVMDPKTGYVKAMCSVPSYDPNSYSVTEPSLFRNTVVSVSYEPGSVFKPVTIAAAIDSGAVEPSTEFVDTGSVQFGKFIIRNAENKIYGKVTMTNVLEQSINTGAIFAMQQMGVQTFEKYVREFGFGRKTQVDLAGEDPGDISPLEKHKEIFSATGSFGQGILVTPLQLVRAFSAIANKGMLPTPTVVRSLILDDGKEKEVPVKEPVQVISRHTADIVSAMLASVVNVGHSKMAGIPGYFTAGKTGTAQVANVGSVGYSEDTIHTFAGFFPLTNPRFVVVVKMTKPKKGKFAESTAVPVFRNLAEFLLQYYKIPPDRVE